MPVSRSLPLTQALAVWQRPTPQQQEHRRAQTGLHQRTCRGLCCGEQHKPRTTCHRRSKAEQRDAACALPLGNLYYADRGPGGEKQIVETLIDKQRAQYGGLISNRHSVAWVQFLYCRAVHGRVHLYA